MDRRLTTPEQVNSFSAGETTEGYSRKLSLQASVVSILAGSEPGGILLAFPAILPATLTLIEKEEGERAAEDFDVGSILGAAALAPLAVVWNYMDEGSAPVVEPLTGSQLAADNSEGPRVSEWFQGGIVAYEPATKREFLGVSDGPVVSERCAVEMD